MPIHRFTLAALIGALALTAASVFAHGGDEGPENRIGRMSLDVVRTRLGLQGYTQIKSLKLNADSVYEAEAIKDGQPVMVEVNPVWTTVLVKPSAGSATVPPAARPPLMNEVAFVRSDGTVTFTLRAPAATLAELELRAMDGRSLARASVRVPGGAQAAVWAYALPAAARGQGLALYLRMGGQEAFRGLILP